MPMVNSEKRRAVMARSMRLGHCICDPRRPCPCDIFTGKGLCPCAGDRPEPADLSTIKLTELVHNAGCASKIAAADLERFLSRLPPVDDPAIISGLPAADDAGLYRISDETTLVQTVDVFTPCVDDPHTFGKICAANCLSDIYAMGGVPKTALSILGFPSETLDTEIAHRMMTGAIETLNEAECALLGGHSIKDEEIKLGFAITGLIDSKKAASHDTASIGDILVLTKPLGVGVLSFAQQIGRINEAGQKQAEQSMMTLNREAALVMNEIGGCACTDVTGFSLFGHLARMVRHSKVTARIYADTLPAFDGSLELLEEGVIPGAIERNSEFVGDDLIVSNNVFPEQKLLGFDAQTSGGLLIAVPKEKHKKLCDGLKDKGVVAYTIGSIIDTSDGKIELFASMDDSISIDTQKPALSTSCESEISKGDKPIPTSNNTQKDQIHDPGCCADIFSESSTETVHGTTAPTSMAAFGDLMQSTGSAGLLDEKTKELITFALVLHSRCEPCLAIHLEKAKNMGITKEELDEAAWCAIAMGGAPVKMFYTSYLEK